MLTVRNADSRPLARRGPAIWRFGGRGCIGLLLTAVLLAGCASVPVVEDEASGPASSEQIRIVGARGPLSKRQSAAILKRLAAQAPNAGALERHLAVEQAVADTPLVAGNRVSILRDGDQTFPAMFAAIRSAQHFLYLEYYIFEDVSCDGQQLGDLLESKARAGVQIYVIYDGIGSIGTPSSFFDRLKAAGVHIIQFNSPNPLRAGWHLTLNKRDHRKMLVADGKVVILGGVNLSSTYESAPGSSGDKANPGADGGRSAPTSSSGDKSSSGEASRSPPAAPPAGRPALPQTPAPAANDHEVWHDTDLQIAGPVVVQLEKLFEEHWQEQDGPPMHDESDAGPAPPEGNEVVRIIGSTPKDLKSRFYVTVLSAIRNAEQSVWITAAYFVPTHQEMEDLLHAARRKVDVRLLLPSQSDSHAALEVQHSHYGKLLRAGVKIYERDDGILHSKTIVVDGVWSIVGSSNFDQRSVLFNDEVDAVVLGKETGTQLTDGFRQDLQHAQPVELNTWNRRSTLTKLREQFWRLWQKLL
ncbi:MAG TPA: phospholipase D-like domain-containing protein [Steroidobacteraceae bacterium]